MIHPSALVDPLARIADSVEIGAFSIIGPDVEIGEGTSIGPHVVIEGPTRIGRDNKIHQFNSLGGPPQDKKYAGEPSRLEIGDRNVIREYCTFNRGTEQGGGVTRIGSDNWIMAYVHIAHDCVLGSGCVLANAATLAGHVRVDDKVILGAFTVVHQFCAIGQFAFSAMGSVVFKDVPPFVTVSGNSAQPHGINSEGLRRAGFEPQTIQALRRAYKTVYKKGLTLENALTEITAQISECREVEPLVRFIEQSSRGLVR
ncbi:MAG: acyl-ACP--UDP-N-acetylglucosamine O-acyltransferase [Gammaproteobacteria bacterium]|nr:acyl-ACP--UDP-N-acetylglucosamine O-acyltransferase [Gammaproteobacteria bacterium]